jgi:hypothetical protein
MYNVDIGSSHTSLIVSFLDTSTNAYAYQAIPHVLYEYQYKPTFFFPWQNSPKN